MHRIGHRIDGTFKQALQKRRLIVAMCPSIQEENEGNKRQARAAQEDAEEWKIKFEAERALRRALNSKLLDMQVRRAMH